MDPEKKKALDLIERSVKKLSITERGHQLICVASDYVDAGELKEAIRVLGMIEGSYYDRAPATEKLYLDSLVNVVNVFGGDLRIFSKQAALS